MIASSSFHDNSTRTNAASCFYGHHHANGRNLPTISYPFASSLEQSEEITFQCEAVKFDEDALLVKYCPKVKQ